MLMPTLFPTVTHTLRHTITLSLSLSLSLYVCDDINWISFSIVIFLLSNTYIYLYNFAPTLGREPWSSGYEGRLMFLRSWVRIPMPYTGWTWHSYTLICCKKLYCLFEKTKNKRKRGRDWSIFFKKCLYPHRKFLGVHMFKCRHIVLEIKLLV